MAHQVSLRTEAYEALKSAKKPRESFSDTVLRILAEHRGRKKDPWIFVHARRTRVRDPEKRLVEVERWRDDDPVDRDG